MSDNVSDRFAAQVKKNVDIPQQTVSIVNLFVSNVV